MAARVIKIIFEIILYFLEHLYELFSTQTLMEDIPKIFISFEKKLNIFTRCLEDSISLLMYSTPIFSYYCLLYVTVFTT
jgi:hypothetical protein